MNAGKTTTLLQSSHNYAERGMNTLLLKPKVDDRDGLTQIKSRIGLEATALCFSPEEDLLELVQERHESKQLHCLLIDEAQFLSSNQVIQLGEIVDQLNIPVLVYGIRTDFRGELFEGSRVLLALADELCEIKTICYCGRKATMVVRLDSKGEPMRTGEQIQIGGNETYVSVCRKHWKASLKKSDS